MRRPAMSLLLGALLAGSASAQPIRDELYSANGAVHAAVEMDGILYIGGEFFEVGIATGSAVPIDAVTGAPQSMPKVVGSVYTVAPDGAGGWFIGGQFTHVGGQPRQNIAHILSDYSVSPWNPGVGPNRVRALAVSGGIVYVGGDFASLGAQPRNNIGAVDAVTGVVTSWNPNASGFVNCLAVDGGVVYAGGSFGTMSTVGRSNLAAMDAVTGALLAWNPGANSAVNAMTVSAGNVYVGGSFTTAGGQTRTRLAALNGISGNASGWNPIANSTVDALVAANGVIYAGGFFTSAGGAGRVGIAALDTVGTGAATAWNPGANGAVHALAVSGSTIYAGGVFTNMGGLTRFRIAAIDTAGTGVTTSWNPRASAIVRAIGAIPGTAFVAGEFNSIGGETRAHLAAIDLGTGMVTSWNPNANNAVRALAARNDTVYVGGLFTNVGSQNRVGIAALNATTGLATSWNPGASAGVLALALDGGTIYAGGDFGTLGGVGRSRIGAINVATGAATSWNPGATGGSVFTLLVSDSVVYAGGTFTGLGGQPRNKTGAVGVGTAIVTGWDPNPSSPNPSFAVRALAAADDAIYIGGEFETVSGLPRTGVAAVDPVSGAPTSWNPGAAATTALCAVPGTVFIGGGANFLTAVSATGQILPWTPAPNGVVRAITVAPGGLYVVGSFTAVSKFSAGGIVGIRPVLVAADVTLTEGDVHLMGIHLLPPTEFPVLAEYATVSGTATASEDFDPVADNLVFNPGEAFKPIPVLVRADPFPEFDETFTLDLTVVDPLDMTARDGIVTIADDDSNGIRCHDFPSVTDPVQAQVYALFEMNGILYVGGDFEAVEVPGGPVVFRRNLAAINLATGLPTAWDPSPNEPVRALYGSGGTIYAGGDFSSIGGQGRIYIGAVDAVTGLATSWDPDANAPVYVITGGGGTLYVGGEFSAIGKALRPFLAALDPTSDFATGWTPSPDEVVRELAVSGGVVYAGGEFQNIGGQSRRALAAIDTATALATAFNAQITPNPLQPTVTALAVHGSTIYAGGSFTLAAGQTRLRVAAFDAATGNLAAWDPNGSGPGAAWAQSMLVHDGMVYVGGTFDNIGGQPRNGLAALGPVTALADPFAPIDVAGTLALASAGGRIYAGGSFPGGLACFVPVAAVDVPRPTAVVEPTLRLSPNPARAVANLDFTMLRDGHARIEVFDVQGRSVAQPVDGEFDAGPHRVTWNASSHGPGLYFVRFEGLGLSFIRRLIVLR